LKLIGGRVWLRDFTESDLSAYAELERHPFIYRYENKAPDDKQIQEDFQEALNDSIGNQRERYKLAVCLNGSTKPIGRVSIQLNWAEIREWEIGWALHPDYWKMGFAAEAAKLLINYAFAELNSHRIVAYANADNEMSEKLMNRVGMIKDGILRETRLCNGKWCNEIVYSVLEREWKH